MNKNQFIFLWLAFAVFLGVCTVYDIKFTDNVFLFVILPLATVAGVFGAQIGD